jgi:hypothetical protein
MDRKLVEQAVPTYNSLRNDLIKHDIEQSYEKLKKAGSEMEVKKGGGGLPPEEPNAGAEEEASKCTEEEISADCNGRRMWEVGFYRLPKSRHTRLHCLFPVVCGLWVLVERKANRPCIMQQETTTAVSCAGNWVDYKKHTPPHPHSNIAICAFLFCTLASFFFSCIIRLW